MNPNHGIRIERLAPDDALAATVSEWTYDTWGHLNPEMDGDAWLREIRDNAGPGGVPSIFVARLDQRAVGTASLVAQDMTIRPALTPWLASVFVQPAARGQGIASALVARVEQEAREARLRHLHLYTPDQQHLYTRLGWQPQETVTYRGEHVTIMQRQL
ncbi:MAG: GNAT family N-acetyltransferase [Salinisphaera sp.]